MKAFINIEIENDRVTYDAGGDVNELVNAIAKTLLEDKSILKVVKRSIKVAEYNDKLKE